MRSSDKYVRSGWGDLYFYQLKKGYRFSIDTVLLASAVSLKNNSKILEAGSGEGVIPVFLTKKGKKFTYTGIEIDEELYKLSQINLQINNIDGSVIHGDFKNLKLIQSEQYDIGITNPPYFKIGTGKRNPDPVEEKARHEITGDLDSALRFLSKGVKKKGKIYVIYPAKRLDHLILTMKKYRISPKKLLIIYPAKREKANFILCEGVKEGGEEVKVVPPLYIYSDPGQKVYTEEMKKIIETLSIEW